MAKPAKVSGASENICKKPTISTSTQRSTERSYWKVESALNADFTATNGLEDLRKNLPSEGISERGS